MTLQNYLQKIRAYPLLTQEEERQIAVLAKNGDYASREKLINSNLRFVVSIAKRYFSNGNALDIIQEGNYGLIEAANRYNPDLGNRFITYAAWWIKQSIFSSFEDQQEIRLPVNQIELRRRIYGIIEDYVSIHPKKPTPIYIAQELNKTGKKAYSAQDVTEILHMYDNVRVSSLHKHVGNEGDTEHIDFIAGSDGRNNAKSVENKSIEEIVHKQMAELDIDDVTRTILMEKLYHNKGINEIAEAMGLGRELVRQRYFKGNRLLKNALKKKCGIYGICWIITRK